MDKEQKIKDITALYKVIKEKTKTFENICVKMASIQEGAQKNKHIEDLKRELEDLKLEANTIDGKTLKEIKKEYTDDIKKSAVGVVKTLTVDGLKRDKKIKASQKKLVAEIDALEESIKDAQDFAPTGDLDMKGFTLKNLREPKADSEPVTRKYFNANMPIGGGEILGGGGGGNASAVSVITDNFDNNLSSNDDTVQKALDTLDDFTAESSAQGKVVDISAVSDFPDPINTTDLPITFDDATNEVQHGYGAGVFADGQAMEFIGTLPAEIEERIIYYAYGNDTDSFLLSTTPPSIVVTPLSFSDGSSSARVAGEIHLADGYRYVLHEAIFTPYDFILPTAGEVGFESIGVTKYPLVYTGLGTMFTGSLTGVLMLRLMVVVCPFGTIFDIDTAVTIGYAGQTGDFTPGQTLTGAASGATAMVAADEDSGTSGTLTLLYPNGRFLPGEPITDPLGGAATSTTSSTTQAFVLSELMIYNDFANWGTVKNTSFFYLQALAFQGGQGLTLENNELTVIGNITFNNWKNEADCVYLNFQGNHNSIQYNNNFAIPNANESVTNFDTTAFFLATTIGNSTFIGAFGGNFFSPTSRDQKDPYINANGNVGLADSKVIGALLWSGNTIETTITAQGVDGQITAFADAGGGQVTVTSTGHGLSNGEGTAIDNSTNYNGLFTISNVTTNTFEITATWVATEVGEWTTGWVKIAGTTHESESIQRCSMTTDNELTFNMLEDQQGNMRVSVDVIRGAGSGTPTLEFTVFKNDEPVLDSSHHVVRSADTNGTTPVGAVIDTPLSVVTGDTVSLYGRNITNTANIIVKNGTMILD